MSCAPIGEEHPRADPASESPIPLPPPIAGGESGVHLGDRPNATHPGGSWPAGDVPPPPATQAGQTYPQPGPAPHAPPVYLFRPRVRANGLCVASLILGSFVIACFFLYAVPSVLAIVLGAIGVAQVKRSGGAQSGSGIGIAGIVLGVVGLTLLVYVFAGSWYITRLR